MIDGGMRMSVLPPAAMQPVAKPSSYPALRSSGSAMRVMVAALASEDPDTAPNKADAASVATASPPRKHDRMTRAPLNSSPESRDSDAISPISTNSGTTERL